MKQIFIAILFLFNSVLCIAQLTFVRTVGNTKLDQPNSMIKTRDGGCLAVGYSYVSDLNSWDVYAVKMDSNYTVKWKNSIGGLVNDTIPDSGGDFGYAVAQVSDGYIITGITYSFGNYDMYIVKLRNNGTLQWTKTIGGNMSDIGYSIIPTSDGGVLIVGSTFSYSKKEDVYIVKLDVNGNLQWTKSYGGSKSDIGYAAVEVNNGYVVTGSTFSFTAGLGDAYVLKIDKNGNLLWSRNIGGSKADVGNSIIKAADNGLLIAGTTSSYGSGDADAFLFKLSGAGNLQWSKCFGGLYADGANQIISTSDGGYALAGDITTEQFKSAKSYILKLDANATKQWSTTIVSYTELSLYAMYNMIETADHGFVLAGQAFYHMPGPNGDFGIIKTDNNGAICASSSVNGTLINVNSGIASPATVVTNENDKLFTRTSVLNSSGTVAEKCSNASRLFAGNSTSITETEKKEAVAIFPNPARDHVIIKWNSLETYSGAITITNVQGRILYTQTYNIKKGINQVVLSTVSLKGGEYFVRIPQKNDFKSMRFIKMD